MTRGVAAYLSSFLFHVSVLAWMGKSMLATPVSMQLESGETLVELTASAPAPESDADPGPEASEPVKIVAAEPPREVTEPEREPPEVPDRPSDTTPPELAVAQASETPPPPVRPQREPPAEPSPAEPTQVIRTHEAKVQEAIVSAPSAVATASVAGSQVDLLPRKVPTNRPPSYPMEALLLGHEGRVVLRVLVGANGLVASVAMETSSKIPSLDRSAIQTISGWRFEPARRRNVAVEYEVLIPVSFSIRLK